MAGQRRGNIVIMGIMINSNWGELVKPISGEPLVNSPLEILRRQGIRLIVANANITGNNASYNVNVFKVTGAIRVIDQFAIITSVTNLTNLSDAYADVWDGTVSVKLTNGNPGGMDLSGAPVGSFFTKDQDSSQAYSVMLSDQGRFLEASNKYVGKPFLINSKNAVNTYIRFNYTTNTVLDFNMSIYFIYEDINGGTIELA